MGANQVTTYKYDGNNRHNEVDKPDGSVIAFRYDADGSRTSKSVSASGTTTTVNDVYQSGRVAYQTDGGALLATFTYDENGAPTSVQVGSNPQTAPRYYYVHNGHGDVVNLVDGGGNVVASYTYDEFGTITASSENLPGGWTNPYRYDGRDLVRYDAETALYWMRVRAYDPTLGRFISRDPLGRVPLMGWTSQPYAYAGNNPLVNVDPNGQRLVGASGAVVSSPRTAARPVAHITSARHVFAPSHHTVRGSGCSTRFCMSSTAKDIANNAVRMFGSLYVNLGEVGNLLKLIGLVLAGVFLFAPMLEPVAGFVEAGGVAVDEEKNFVNYEEVQFAWNEGWNSPTDWETNASLEQVRNDINSRFDLFEYLTLRKCVEEIAIILTLLPSLPGWIPGSDTIKQLKGEGRELDILANSLPREDFKQLADDYVSQEEQYLNVFS